MIAFDIILHVGTTHPRMNILSTRRQIAIPFAALALFAAVSSAQRGTVPTWRVSRGLIVSASAESLDRPIRPIVTRLGTIFVADNANGMVSAYDGVGRRLSRAGGKGRGPGELQEFTQVRGSIGDSAWFCSTQQLRVVVYSPQGKPARTSSLPSLGRLPAGSTSQVIRGLVPLALLPEGSIVAEGSLRDAAEDALPSGTSYVAVISPSGTVTRTLGSFNDSLRFVSVKRGRAHHSYVVPFAFSRFVRASADGAFIMFVTGRNGRNKADTVQVTALRPNGDTAYSLRQVLSTVPVPDARFARARESRLDLARQAGVESELRDALRVRMPRTHPVITDGIITSEGRAWLRLHPTADSVKYMSIAPSGKPDGMVSLPAGAVVVDGWGDQLWAIETDADGFADIVRYKVHRQVRQP